MDSIDGIPEISPQSLKNLGDKSYEKRKSAAQEIVDVVDKFHTSHDTEKIKTIFTFLQNNYLKSSIPSTRNGGLIAVASVAIDLESGVVDYIPLFLSSVLKCLNDSDKGVRYYTSEALYNIAKAAQTGILSYLHYFFYALCQLFADVDTDVKKISFPSSMLDRLLKEIVAESKVIDLTKFTPVLKQYLGVSNPYVRRLVVSWISILDNKPGVDMMEFFPQIIENLFMLLGDDHREIRVETDDLLSSFLSEIKGSEINQVLMNSMINVLLSLCHHNDRFIRLTAVIWIYEFILLEDMWSIPYARVLRALLPCYDDPEKEVKSKADAACQELVNSLKKKGVEISVLPIVEVVCSSLQKQHHDQCLLCFKVILVLLEIKGKEVVANTHLREMLLLCLKEDNDDVVDANLKVLMKYVECSDSLSEVIDEIVDMLEKDQQYMEERGLLIIRTLCKYKGAQDILPLLATIIINNKNIKFASLFVQLMNTVLLTADEAMHFCSSLRSCFSPTKPDLDGQRCFDTLFPAWSINIFSALSLCWLTEEYSVAYAITQHLAYEEITLAMLLQADKLVKLLESPAFVHIRIQLISSDTPNLVLLLQSLYGLLMLLPQSTSYCMLQNRLSGVTPLHVVLRDDKTIEMDDDDKKRVESFKAINRQYTIVE